MGGDSRAPMSGWRSEKEQNLQSRIPKFCSAEMTDEKNGRKHDIGFLLDGIERDSEAMTHLLRG
jgi:hypothetical protein